jgi:hypothetical protein
MERPSRRGQPIVIGWLSRFGAFLPYDNLFNITCYTARLQFLKVVTLTTTIKNFPSKRCIDEVHACLKGKKSIRKPPQSGGAIWDPQGREYLANTKTCSGERPGVDMLFRS